MLDYNHKAQVRIFPTAWGYFGLKTHHGRLSRTCLPLPDPADVEHQLGLSQEPAQHNPDLCPALQQRIQAYYAGQSTTFDGQIPLDLSGFSAFGRAVLLACHRLAYGEKMTYGQLAQAAGHPGAARAVGQIMARNRLPLIIPCHRIIAAGHQPGGFSAPGGVSTKQKMLALESRETEDLTRAGKDKLR